MRTWHQKYWQLPYAIPRALQDVGKTFAPSVLWCNRQWRHPVPYSSYFQTDWNIQKLVKWRSSCPALPNVLLIISTRPEQACKCEGLKSPQNHQKSADFLIHFCIHFFHHGLFWLFSMSPETPQSSGVPLPVAPENWSISDKSVFQMQTYFCFIKRTWAIQPRRKLFSNSFCGKCMWSSLCDKSPILPLQTLQTFSAILCCRNWVEKIGQAP